MNFNICMGNFYTPGYPESEIFQLTSSLADGVRFVRRALESAGHHVTVNAAFIDKDAVNIFWERFYDFSDNPPTKLKKLGYRYGIICTEPMTTEGRYNPFEFDDVTAAKIYQDFSDTLRQADFVWHILEEAGPCCRRLNPNSHLLPFGYVEGYAELAEPRSRRLIADFICQGHISGRRADICAILKQRGHTVNMAGIQPEFIRISMLESARVLISIQKTPEHSIFSVTRVYHSIMNRIPLVMEYNGPPTYLSKYCLAVPTDQFISECCDVIERGDYFAAGQDVYDRFSREMPAVPMMEKLITATFREMG
jgi:hypothetical protein